MCGRDVHKAKKSARHRSVPRTLFALQRLRHLGDHRCHRCGFHHLPVSEASRPLLLPSRYSNWMEQSTHEHHHKLVVLSVWLSILFIPSSCLYPRLHSYRYPRLCLSRSSDLTSLLLLDSLHIELLSSPVLHREICGSLYKAGSQSEDGAPTVVVPAQVPGRQVDTMTLSHNM